MTEWPRHGRIDGAIVMIGFGSIGKGTLPLIERHFDYDKNRFVVIDPVDADRGLLDETLVVLISDFGRTPRVNKDAGRDHWTYCYSVVFAGAGIRGGSVHGASDRDAAFVKDCPISPADVCATIYHCLGIDPHQELQTGSGRPVTLFREGKVIDRLLG